MRQGQDGVGHSVEYMLAPRPMSSPIDQLDPQPPKLERCVCVHDAAAERLAERGWGARRCGFLGGCTSAHPWATAFACRRPPAAPPASRKAASLRAVRHRGSCSFELDARSQAGQNGAVGGGSPGLRAAGTSRTPVALPRDAGGLSLPAFGRAALIARFSLCRSRIHA